MLHKQGYVLCRHTAPFFRGTLPSRRPGDSHPVSPVTEEALALEALRLLQPSPYVRDGCPGQGCACRASCQTPPTQLDPHMVERLYGHLSQKLSHMRAAAVAQFL